MVNWQGRLEALPIRAWVLVYNFYFTSISSMGTSIEFVFILLNVYKIQRFIEGTSLHMIYLIICLTLSLYTLLS
jgi:hypothetical protein